MGRHAGQKAQEAGWAGSWLPASRQGTALLPTSFPARHLFAVMPRYARPAGTVSGPAAVHPACSSGLALCYQRPRPPPRAPPSPPSTGCPTWMRHLLFFWIHLIFSPPGPTTSFTLWEGICGVGSR